MTKMELLSLSGWTVERLGLGKVNYNCGSGGGHQAGKTRFNGLNSHGWVDFGSFRGSDFIVGCCWRMDSVLRVELFRRGGSLWKRSNEFGSWRTNEKSIQHSSARLLWQQQQKQRQVTVFAFVGEKFFVVGWLMMMMVNVQNLVMDGEENGFIWSSRSTKNRVLSLLCYWWRSDGRRNEKNMGTAVIAEANHLWKESIFK